MIRERDKMLALITLVAEAKPCLLDVLCLCCLCESLKWRCSADERCWFYGGGLCCCFIYYLVLSSLHMKLPKLSVRCCLNEMSHEWLRKYDIPYYSKLYQAKYWLIYWTNNEIVVIAIYRFWRLLNHTSRVQYELTLAPEDVNWDDLWSINVFTNHENEF